MERFAYHEPIRLLDLPLDLDTALLNLIVTLPQTFQPGNHCVIFVMEHDCLAIGYPLLFISKRRDTDAFKSRVEGW